MDLNWQHLDDQGFERLCCDLVLRVLPAEVRGAFEPTSMPYQPDGQTDGWLPRDRFEGLKPPVAFSFKTSAPGRSADDASKRITDSFLKGLDKLLARQPRSIVLWANHDFRPTDRRRLERAVAGRATLQVEGRKQLETRALRHSSLLTKYFRWSQYLVAFDGSDLDGLKSEIAGGPLAGMFEGLGTPHPKVVDLGPQDARRFRVIGGPGSGKSVFLLQLAARLAVEEILVLRSLDAAEVWMHLREVLEAPPRRRLLVIDNLHDYLNRAHSCGVLGLVLDGGERSDAGSYFVVSHWSSERLDLEAQVSAAQWERWGFLDLVLDEPPRAFMTDVTAAICRHKQIEVDPQTLERFVDEIVDWENTPACAAAALFPYRGTRLNLGSGFHPVDLSHRESRWQLLFRGLEAANDQTAIAVLRALSFFRHCRVDRPLVDEVASMCGAVADLAYGDVTAAVERLEATGWVSRNADRLQAHDVQLSPKVLGIIGDSEPSLFLERVRRRLVEGWVPPSCLPRKEALNALGWYYWQTGRFDVVLAATEAILAEDPSLLGVQVNRGQALLKLGRTDEGFESLSAVCSNVTEEAWIVRVLTDAAWALHQKDRGRVILERLAESTLLAPDVLRALAYGLADLGGRRRALAVARRLQASGPEDPEAMATLVQVLRVCPRRSGAAARVLEKALEKWPQSGLLLGVRALLAMDRNDADAALPAAREAVRLRPNDAMSHTILAWCLFVKGLVEEAAEVAEVGLRLFKGWPDLLAVAGLAAENRGENQRARQLLQQAVSRVGQLGQWLEPNAYLGLARIALKSGTEADAKKWFEEAELHGVARAFCLGEKSRVLAGSGRLDEGIATREEAAALEPDEPSHWRALAELLLQAKEKERLCDVLLQLTRLEPRVSLHWGALGAGLLDLCRPADALPALQEAVRLGPSDSGMAQAHLGECLLELNRIEEGIAAIEAAKRDGHVSSESSLRLAMAYCQVGRAAEGVDLAASVVEPGWRARALGVEAHCLLAQGKRRDAARKVKESLAAEAENGGPLASLLRIAAQIEDHGLVLRIWRRMKELGAKPLAGDSATIYRAIERSAALGKDHEVLELLELEMAAEGLSWETLLNLARCLRRLGRDEEAISQYSEALDVKPLNLVCAIERAALLIGLGRGEEASDPDGALLGGLVAWRAMLYAAHGAAGLGDAARAANLMIECARALPDPPKSGSPRVENLEEVIEHLKLRSAIEAHMRAVDAAVAEDPGVLHLRAALSGDDAERASLLRRAHAAAPLRPALALELGRAELDIFNLPAALEIARRVLALRSLDAPVMAETVDLLERCGAPADEIMVQARRAIEAAGPDRRPAAAARRCLAEALIKSGRAEEAIPEARAAYEEFEGAVIPALTLARALEGGNRLEEAVEICDAALSRTPNDVMLRVARATLLGNLGRDQECIEAADSLGPAAMLLVVPVLAAADSLTRLGRNDEARLRLAAVRKHIVESHDWNDHPASDPTERSSFETFIGWFRRVVDRELRLIGAGSDPAPWSARQEILGDAPVALVVASGFWLPAAQAAGVAGDYERALAICERAIVAGESREIAFVLAASALLQLGRVAEALEVVDRSLCQSAEGEARLAYLRSECLAKLGRADEALAAMDAIIELYESGRLDPPFPYGGDLVARCSAAPRPTVRPLKVCVVFLAQLVEASTDFNAARTLALTMSAWDWSDLVEAAWAGDDRARLAATVCAESLSQLGLSVPPSLVLHTQSSS